MGGDSKGQLDGSKGSAGSSGSASKSRRARPASDAAPRRPGTALPKSRAKATGGSAIVRARAAKAEQERQALELDRILLGEPDALGALEGAASSIGDFGVDVDGLVELVEAELVPDSADLVAEAFFDGQGRLSRSPVREVGPLPVGTGVGLDAVLAELSVAQELEDAAHAQATRKGYGWHAGHFVAWCRERGVSPLPAHARVVQAHLTRYALVFDSTGQPARTDSGELIPAVSPGSVAMRLAAINKLHEYAGFPRPGSSRQIQDFMRGIRRTFLVRARNSKAALDMDGLRAILALLDEGALVRVRLRAMLLLRANGRLSAEQLSLLEWADVDFTDEGAILSLRSKASRPTRIVRLARVKDEAVCPVATLERLRRLVPHLGRVFVSPSGKPMSRQGVHAAISAAVQDVGGWDALSAMSTSALKKFLGPESVDVGPKALRDRSMLTIGWFLALRRSNLVGLNWADVRDHGDRLEVFLSRSKTDQEGLGKTLWIPEVLNSSVPCPVAAYRAYRAMVIDQVGREPDGSMPLFAPFDRHGLGRWGSRLDGNDVNVLIQDLAVRAGLTPKPKAGAKNPFGAHSLRAGFVTEALRDDKLSISQVQEVTQHKSVDVLMRYRREAQGASSASIAKLTALL